MNRFFAERIEDSKAFLSEDDAYHLKNVLRARPGEKFEICNGIDKEYIAVLSYIVKKTAQLDKTERLQKIAAEAAKQSKRTRIPSVHKTVKFDDIIRSAPADALKIIAWEEEKNSSLGSVLNLCGGCNEIYIMVGPEGGLSESEVKYAVEYGWKSITLGKRILRTETAPLALISAIAYHFGDFS